MAAKSGEVIAASLRGRIVRGELVVGDSLPSEVELMAEFDVSRPTLREAFRILEVEQLIKIRQGSRGARILAPDVAVAAGSIGLLLQMAGATLADVYQARAVLEPAAAGLLARRRTIQDVEDLSAGVQELERLIEAGELPGQITGWVEATERCDELIMERAGNTTLAVQSRVLRQVVARHRATVARRPGQATGRQRDFRRSARAYRTLLDLIAARNAEGAERHWREEMEAAARSPLPADVSSPTVLDLFT